MCVEIYTTDIYSSYSNSFNRGTLATRTVQRGFATVELYSLKEGALGNSPAVTTEHYSSSQV